MSVSRAPSKTGVAKWSPRARPAQPRCVSRILADVHAAGHAQRVQDDLDRSPVREVRHVLLGQDARDDALVAVPAGHLVADLELALHGDVDLDQLDDPGGSSSPFWRSPMRSSFTRWSTSMCESVFR